MAALASAGLGHRRRDAAGQRTAAEGFFRLGAGASGYSFSFSLALMGAGHLVGISVGVAMLLGIAIAWVGAVPVLTAMTPQARRAWRISSRRSGAPRCASSAPAPWRWRRSGRWCAPSVRSWPGWHRWPARSVAAARDDHTDRDISMPLDHRAAGWPSLLVAAVLVWHFASRRRTGRQRRRHRRARPFPSCWCSASSSPPSAATWRD